MFARQYGILQRIAFSPKRFPENIEKSVRKRECKGEQGKLCKAFLHKK